MGKRKASGLDNLPSPTPKNQKLNDPPTFPSNPTPIITNATQPPTLLNKIATLLQPLNFNRFSFNGISLGDKFVNPFSTINFTNIPSNVTTTPVAPVNAASILPESYQQTRVSIFSGKDPIMMVKPSTPIPTTPIIPTTPTTPIISTTTSPLATVSTPTNPASNNSIKIHSFPPTLGRTLSGKALAEKETHTTSLPITVDDAAPKPTVVTTPIAHVTPLPPSTPPSGISARDIQKNRKNNSKLASFEDIEFIDLDLDSSCGTQNKNASLPNKPFAARAQGTPVDIIAIDADQTINFQQSPSSSALPSSLPTKIIIDASSDGQTTVTPAKVAKITKTKVRKVEPPSKKGRPRKVQVPPANPPLPLPSSLPIAPPNAPLASPVHIPPPSSLQPSSSPIFVSSSPCSTPPSTTKSPHPSFPAPSPIPSDASRATPSASPAKPPASSPITIFSFATSPDKLAKRSVSTPITLSPITPPSASTMASKVAGSSTSKANKQKDVSYEEISLYSPPSFEEEEEDENLQPEPEDLFQFPSIPAVRPNPPPAAPPAPTPIPLSSEMKPIEPINRSILKISDDKDSVMMIDGDSKVLSVEPTVNEEDLPVPDGWTRKITPKGNILYRNIATGEISTVYPGKKVETPKNDDQEGYKVLYENETQNVNVGQGEQLPRDPEAIDEAAQAQIFSRPEIKEDIFADGSKIPGLKVELLEHQKFGVNWMLSREKSRPRGGILADDMGCGKTIMTISILLQSYAEEPNQKTLIICPLPLMNQWYEEIKTKTDNKIIKKVKVLYGVKDAEKGKRIVKKNQVIITSYGFVRTDLARERDVFSTIRWNRIILDEAHIIKNRATANHKAVIPLSANARWCLTGTPILNSINDLQSLLAFVQFSPYSEFSFWKNNVLWEYSFNPAECLIRLRVILKGLILRRRKTDPEISDVIKLTKKIEETKELVFSESEKQDYLALEANYQKEFHKIARNDSDVRSNYLDILILIHYLRLACCHPIFLKKLLEKSTMGSADKIVPLRSASSVLSNKKLKLLENQENHCRICQEDIEDSDVRITPCAHKFCNECISNWLQQQTSCPLCKSDIFSVNELLVLEEEDTSETQEDVLKGDLGLSEIDGDTLISSSTKVTALMNHIQHVLENNKGDKILIVSQWTRYLAIIQKACRSRDIGFMQLDGTLSVNQRKVILQSFREEGTVRVLLLSMKAAGLGLNITVANHVILMDLWWNLPTETQVVDRVYRIGQTKTVYSTRFTIKDTIEERIIELQNRKMTEASILDGGGSGRNTLNFRELSNLFGPRRSLISGSLVQTNHLLALNAKLSLL